MKHFTSIFLALVVVFIAGFMIAFSAIVPGLAFAQSAASTASFKTIRSDATLLPEISNQCIYVSDDLWVGKKDTTTNDSVVNLQAFLYKHTYLKVEPTGYFGGLTLKAVREFQRDNNLPTTGYFGPLSRGHMKRIGCGTTAPAVTVLSPNGGEMVTLGTTQQITWKSYMPYPTFAAVGHTIKLVTPLPACAIPATPNAPICLIAVAPPVTVAENVVGETFNWIVGSSTKAHLEGFGGEIKGRFYLEVCMSGTQTCDQSNDLITIQ